jgi:hypothetical protein
MANPLMNRSIFGNKEIYLRGIQNFVHLMAGGYAV